MKEKLIELIQDGEITFHSEKGKAHVQIANVGQHHWSLALHLDKQLGKRVVVKGAQEYLAQHGSQYPLLGFLQQVDVALAYQKNYQSEGRTMHVHADVDELIQVHDTYLYQPQGRDLLIEKWYPKLSLFQKSWNESLLAIEADIMGFPGFEYPDEYPWHRERVGFHHERYIIGIDDQLEWHNEFVKGMPSEEKVRKIVGYYQNLKKK